MMIAKGKDNKLLSNTIDTSLREPDFVDFFASSMTHLRVSCREKENIQSKINLDIIDIFFKKKVFIFTIINPSNKLRRLLQIWKEKQGLIMAYRITCSKNAIHNLPGITDCIKGEICNTSTDSRDNLYRVHTRGEQSNTCIKTAT